ncbi:MAG: hypothetical protein Q7I94_06080, partial [Candidatus Contubernalis sp.]|nr:hypothetical protein [Candidatus Contubernalis sp.]
MPCSQFSYLFAVSDNPFPEADEIEIYRAYGNVNEVSEVFRRIKKEKIPLDEVLVCYTHGSTYIPLIYSAVAALNIPVTFAEGVPIFLTRPGKFINSLLSWLEDNCSVSWITRLLNGGFMNISRGNILAQLLRESGVGWGPERYSTCLKSMMDQLEEKVKIAAKKGSERKKEYLMTRLEQVGYLNDVLQDFLLNTSEFSYEEKINTAAFCDGLSSLVKKYAAVKSPEDAAALGSLLQELEDAAGFFPKPISGRAVLKTLKGRIKSLMAGSSGPEPGFLHLTPFTRREAVQRSNTFIIGLDSNSFPGKGLQDPILLDNERERISQNLFLRSAELERNVHNLASFLASRRGKMFLSFSCYDPVEGRPLNPTPLLLQVYRLKQRKPYADYSKFLCFLPSPSCYFSSEEKAVLGEDDAWLHLTLSKKHYAGSLSEVCSCYHGLGQGIRAEEARSSLELTAYDGKITIDPGKVDPRLNSRKSISVTGMEFLAKCPFAY